MTAFVQTAKLGLLAVAIVAGFAVRDLPLPADGQVAGIVAPEAEVEGYV